MQENTSFFQFRDLIIFIQFVFIIWILFKDKYFEWARLKKIKRSGDYGERLVREYLDDLEEVPFIYHGLLGKFEKQTYEIDHLLLTHQGIILIETKNIRGTISTKKDGAWCQIKKSESGKSYERVFKSPIQQIERTSRVFQSFLQSKGLKVKVVPIVVFSNRDVKLKMGNQKLPVLQLFEVSSFIESVSRDIPLSTRQLRGLKDVIEKSFDLEKN